MNSSSSSSSSQLYQPNGTPRAQPVDHQTNRNRMPPIYRAEIGLVSKLSLFFSSFCHLFSFLFSVRSIRLRFLFIHANTSSIFHVTCPTGSHQWRPGTVDPYTCPRQTRWASQKMQNSTDAIGIENFNTKVKKPIINQPVNNPMYLHRNGDDATKDRHCQTQNHPLNSSNHSTPQPWDLSWNNDLIGPLTASVGLTFESQNLLWWPVQAWRPIGLGLWRQSAYPSWSCHYTGSILFSNLPIHPIWNRFLVPSAMHPPLSSDYATLELFFALSKSSFPRIQYFFIHYFDANFFTFDPRSSISCRWHVQTHRIPVGSGLQSTIDSPRTMQDRGYEAVSICYYELAPFSLSLSLPFFPSSNFVTFGGLKLPLTNIMPERGHHQHITKIPNFSRSSGRLQKSTARGRHNGQNFTYLF